MAEEGPVARVLLVTKGVIPQVIGSFTLCLGPVVCRICCGFSSQLSSRLAASFGFVNHGPACYSELRLTSKKDGFCSPLP